MHARTIVTMLSLSAIALSPVHGACADEYDYTRDKVLHVVATAHLDTQWRWTIQRTIDEYIPNTLRRNFTLFKAYPDYIFSFEGAFRYKLAKEYYPRDFEQLREYVRAGRWAVCGSSWDAGDVNIPSPEAVMRNILYGNGFFRREFGKTSRDIFLPDCFGFGYALPTIAAHCGLKGFSTQKLTWGSSVGIPFDIGAWEGVDGSRLAAQLNPDPYVSRIRGDLSSNERWVKTIEKQKEETGLSVGYKYFGVGDVGGAPDSDSVSELEKSIGAGGPLTVISAPADRLAAELNPAYMDRLPVYNGELLMTTHGTGCYTSLNSMKRWNRQNELLADAAERASVAADWLGGAVYQREKLREAWEMFVWHQFHDDLTGTSIPEAYEFSWNDEIIALNRFSTVLRNSVGAVARILDTQVEGEPLVVFNPLSFEREDIVEADVVFPGGAPSNVRVFGPDGGEVPSQVTGTAGNVVTVVFTAKVPSVGFAVFDVRPANAPCQIRTGLRVTSTTLENDRYRVSLDGNGDVASITDKTSGGELLDEPIRLAVFDNYSPVWPAWEITYETVSADPAAHVGGPVSTRIVESGPARAAIEITRTYGQSTFIQTISLGAGGAGDRIEFDNDIDWRSKGKLLKAVFPLKAANPTATYDLGLGVIRRGNNTERLYEVPAQQWADITDTGGGYGVTVMNDCLYGWDKPSDNTLRLTMIHTPEPRSYADQAMQDIGRHRMSFAVTGHTGDWRDGGAVRKAARLNQKLIAFGTSKHDGERGRSFSFLRTNAPGIAVKALKKAEESDEIVLRIVETAGSAWDDIEYAFPLPILSAREINGAEEPVGGATVENGVLVTDLKPYQPRTFALKLDFPDVALSSPYGRPADLPFDIDVVSADDDYADGDMDGEGHTLPGELLPSVLRCEGVAYQLGPSETGMKNALVCRGQTIELPPKPRLGYYNKVYVLAAAVGGDTEGTFTVGEREVTVGIQDYTGFVGQWDNRLVNGTRATNVFQVKPGYIKRDDIAWVGTHRHDAGTGNEAYVFTYIFRYGFDLEERESSLTLPDNENIRVFAVTAAIDLNAGTVPAQFLYDDITATSVTVETDAGGGYFVDSATVGLKASPEDAAIRYTLDGSEPTMQSKAYGGPFTVTGDLTVKARAFKEGIGDNRLMVVEFKKLEPRKSLKAADMKSGLYYRIYHGEWSELPDFEKLTAKKSGVIKWIGLPPGVPEDRFAVYYRGYIEAPRDGVYTFYTRSDDGSRLYIGNRLVVDNDGLHGVNERHGVIALKAGYHPIEVTFFEKGGGQEISAAWQGPGIEKQDIGPGALFHR